MRRLTFLDTCTLAIMMLKSFNPHDLDLPSTAAYPGYDVTTFPSLWIAAAHLSTTCISRNIEQNDTGAPEENFAFTVGWSPAGT